MAAPSMSLVDTSKPGVGNYKGVMLCNRPFAGTKATTHAGDGGGGGGNTFRAGVVPEPLGIPIPISTKDAKKLHRPKKESVLQKHKKWLHDLQKTKDSLEVQYIDEMNKKAESVARFQEQEKKMRLIAREMLRAEEKPEHSSIEASSSSSGAGGGDKGYGGGAGSSSSEYSYKADSHGGPETSSPTGSSEAKADAKPSGKESKALASKPAWALTERTAEEKARYSEEKELADEEGLLDFAKSLDFDKYLGDMEVKAMMTQLAQRISQLEREVSDDASREMDQEERQRNRELLRAALEQQALHADSGSALSVSEETKMMQAAGKLLEEGDLGSVHSKKSVAAMLAAAKEKISNVAQTVALTKALETADDGPREAKITGGPVIVTHEPSEGTRINGKQTVSNLPYQHRNPAV